jgi:ribonuclease HI
MVAKYYAVVCGREPGIYTDWPTTEKMVKGFPGAIFKSFRTRAEADAFMKQSTACTTEATTTTPHVLPLIDRTIIYTDGSFRDRKCGFGIVIIPSTGEKIIAYGHVPEQLGLTNNVAELYAIYVALSLVNGAAIVYSDSQYSISALTTYIHDWIKNGWPGVANRHLIEETYEKMKGRDITLQHVPAHSGVELNEEVDRLADQGRLQTEGLIVLKNGVRIM